MVHSWSAGVADIVAPYFPTRSRSRRTDSLNPSPADVPPNASLRFRSLAAVPAPSPNRFVRPGRDDDGGAVTKTLESTRFRDRWSSAEWSMITVDRQQQHRHVIGKPGR